MKNKSKQPMFKLDLETDFHLGRSQDHGKLQLFVIRWRKFMRTVRNNWTAFVQSERGKHVAKILDVTVDYLITLIILTGIISLILMILYALFFAPDVPRKH